MPTLFWVRCYPANSCFPCFSADDFHPLLRACQAITGHVRPSPNTQEGATSSETRNSSKWQTSSISQEGTFRKKGAPLSKEALLWKSRDWLNLTRTRRSALSGLAFSQALATWLTPGRVSSACGGIWCGFYLLNQSLWEAACPMSRGIITSVA